MTTFDPLTQPLRGTHSIEASAGTGKTYSITLLWLRLLIEFELPIEQILVSTFTTAATAELKERLLSSLRKALTAAQSFQKNQSLASDCPIWAIIKQRAPSASGGISGLIQRLARAVSSFDLAPISTLHGFCQSLITRHALELGCDSGLKLVPDCEDLLHQIVDDQLMLMADEPGIQPGILRDIASKTAKTPTAELRYASPAAEAELATMRLRILQEAPLACANVSPKRSRDAVDKILIAFHTEGSWKGFSATQAPQLDAAFLALWNSYPTLRSQLERLPGSRIAVHIAGTFQERKLAAGFRSFDDILLTVQTALHDQGPNGNLAQAVRKRLRAAIIDECQDSDGVQIDVFEQLFRHEGTASFIVIGDPKQSIYRFRGADLVSYKRLAGSALQAPMMSTNHRSDPPLIEAINSLYRDYPAFPDALNPNHLTRYIPVCAKAKESRIIDPKPLPGLVFQWTEATKRGSAKARLAEQVATECARLLREGVEIEDRHTQQKRPIRPGDMAVLAAGHRDLQLLRRHLTQVNIACQSSGKGLGSVFGSNEAQDILAWLTLLSTIQGRGDVLHRLLTFLGTPLGGFSPIELTEVRENAARQAELCAAFQKSVPELTRSGPLPLLLRHLAKKRAINTNLAFAEGERRYTNWQHIGSLLQHEHGRGRRGAEALTLWLARQSASKPESVSVDPESEQSALMKLETDAEAVQLVTIHNSKGLEYPVVFCPFLWHVKSLKHRKSQTARVRGQNGWILDVGSGEFDVHQGTEIAQEDEEEHRKLYVALTRARHRLYLGMGAVTSGGRQYDNGAEKSALAQLLQFDALPQTEWHEALTQLEQSVVLYDTTPITSENSEFPSPATSSVVLRAPDPIAPYPYSFQRTASFSSLSKSDQEHLAPTDRDEDQSGPEFTNPNRPDLLQALGKAGAVLGDQLHRVLEEYLGNRKELAEAITEVENPEAWTDPINTILDTPLILPGCCPATLRAIRDGCITEMQFHLPVTSLNPEALSLALTNDETIRNDADRLDWAKELAFWSFNEFGGFLQGFIDLIFEHEGRWFIADYKSNTLNHYTPKSLETAMLEKNYLLQARFYALALHRHLQVQLPGYNYDLHFGGVAYLFVRAFPEHGLWFERPSVSALNHLGSLFQSPSR